MSGGYWVDWVCESSGGNQRVTWRSDVHPGTHAGLESSKSLSSWAHLNKNRVFSCLSLHNVNNLGSLVEVTPFNLYPIFTLSSSQTPFPVEHCVCPYSLQVSEGSSLIKAGLDQQEGSPCS